MCVCANNLPDAAEPMRRPVSPSIALQWALISVCWYCVLILVDYCIARRDESTGQSVERLVLECDLSGRGSSDSRCVSAFEKHG